MRALRALLVALAVFAVAAKLFTYEFYLTDDTTSGVALRATPSLESRMLLRNTSSSGTDWILLRDENGFLGQGVYRFTVQAGWILISVLAFVGTAASYLAGYQKKHQVNEDL